MAKTPKRRIEHGRKVLVGVIHLPALPGSPRWKGDLDSAIKFAVRDALAYERGGADALFIENFGDVPFTKGSVGPETVAEAVRAGVEVLVAGNAVFGEGNPRENTRHLLKLATEATLQKV